MPRLLGTDLEMHHRVRREGLAHALGSQRAPAERDDARVGPREELEDRLLLARAEGVLALAVEPALDRLPERLLDLAVGVERLDAQVGSGDPGGGRLAGAHEADEDECPAYRFQPIRSRYAANAARTSSMWSPPNFSR